MNKTAKSVLEDALYIAVLVLIPDYFLDRLGIYRNMYAIIQKKERLKMDNWIFESEATFRYQLLDRMRQDCDYYLGNGNRNPKNLCEGDEKKQIQAMKDIWNSFPNGEKPEWLTPADILEYERRMMS